MPEITFVSNLRRAALGGNKNARAAMENMIESVKQMRRQEPRHALRFQPASQKAEPAIFVDLPLNQLRIAQAACSSLTERFDDLKQEWGDAPCKKNNEKQHLECVADEISKASTHESDGCRSKNFPVFW